MDAEKNSKVSKMDCCKMHGLGKKDLKFKGCKRSPSVPDAKLEIK